MPPEPAAPQSFRPRARLLRQLGDELIRNESVAFHELIKNSYDADAKKVSIVFEGSNKPEVGTIRITDNGKGMSLTEVESFWLQIGTDNKVAENARIDASEKNSRKRRPLGEKGIGRFAVGKLGDHVIMITKASKHKEVVVEVDWEEIFAKEFLDEAEIKIKENDLPQVFKKGQTGTTIVISRLKKAWRLEDRIEIKRAAVATESPFNKPEDFAITVTGETPSELKAITSSKELLQSALYTFDCTIEGQEITEFVYKFRPWHILSKVKARTITLKDDKELQKTTKLKRLKAQSKSGKSKDYEIINLGAHKIGPVRFSGYVFNLEPRVMKLGNIDPATLKKYMNENGGVRVFRDGIRVYDYGEPGNDWLKLGARRVAKPGQKLDSGLMIGAVNLVRAKSKDLVEKTNREGFIENEAYGDLRDAIVFALDKVEILRRVDQLSIRTYYGGGGNKHEPVVETIEEIRDILDRTKLEKSVHEQFVRCLDQVEKEYNQITRVLVTGATSGLHLSMVIHEIEKVLKELNQTIKSERVSARATAIIGRLNELMGKYSGLTKGKNPKPSSLKSVIKNAIFLAETRLSFHRIKIVDSYNRFKGDDTVFCDASLISSSLLNLLDNSIYWLGDQNINPKQIYIDIKKDDKNHLRIVYCDNGNGYTLNRALLGQPFTSNKPSGSGLGLHLVSQVMEFHRGEALFFDGKDCNAPPGFEEGAAAVLRLPIRKPDVPTDNNK